MNKYVEVAGLNFDINHINYYMVRNSAWICGTIALHYSHRRTP